MERMQKSGQFLSSEAGCCKVFQSPGSQEVTRKAIHRLCLENRLVSHEVPELWLVTGVSGEIDTVLRSLPGIL